MEGKNVQLLYICTPLITECFDLTLKVFIIKRTLLDRDLVSLVVNVECTQLDFFRSRRNCSVELHLSLFYQSGTLRRIYIVCVSVLAATRGNIFFFNFLI